MVDTRRIPGVWHSQPWGADTDADHVTPGLAVRGTGPRLASPVTADNVQTERR